MREQEQQGILDKEAVALLEQTASSEAKELRELRQIEEEDTQWRKAEEDRKRQEMEAKTAGAELNIVCVRMKKAVLQVAIDARKKKLQVGSSDHLSSPNSALSAPVPFSAPRISSSSAPAPSVPHEEDSADVKPTAPRPALSHLA